MNNKVLEQFAAAFRRNANKSFEAQADTFRKQVAADNAAAKARRKQANLDSWNGRQEIKENTH